MLPHPHIQAHDRAEIRRGKVITELIPPDTRNDRDRTAREPGLSNRPGRARARWILKSRATLPVIVAIEGAVFLAVLYTLARGPADLSSSTWVLAALAVLFFVLTRLRRWATACALED